MKKIIISFCLLLSFYTQAAQVSETSKLKEEDKLLLVCSTSKVALKNFSNNDDKTYSVKYKKTTSLVKGNYFYIFKLLDKKVNIICQHPDVNEIDKTILTRVSKLVKIKNKIYQIN